jgi:hypothetical protein
VREGSSPTGESTARARTEVGIPWHLCHPLPHSMCLQSPLTVTWRTRSDLICLGKEIVMTKQKEKKKKSGGRCPPVTVAIPNSGFQSKKKKKTRTNKQKQARTETHVLATEESCHIWISGPGPSLTPWPPRPPRGTHLRDGLYHGKPHKDGAHGMVLPVVRQAADAVVTVA